MSTTYLVRVVGLTFVYTLGEELGWRGFLQDALRPIPKPGRYVLIGAMWEFWHFTNRIYGNEDFLLTLAVSYPVLIIVSWIIGEATDRSKSLCIAVTLHAWGQYPVRVQHVPDYLRRLPARAAVLDLPAPHVGREGDEVCRAVTTSKLSTSWGRALQ